MTTGARSISYFAPDLLEQANGFPVGLRKSVGRVAELRSPIRVGSPRRAFEYQASAEPPGKLRVRSKVLAKRCFAFRSPKEVEGSEVGKLQSFVEDEGSFDAAIGEEKIAAKLRQSVLVSSHVFPSFRLLPDLTLMTHSDIADWAVVSGPVLPTSPTRRAWPCPFSIGVLMGAHGLSATFTVDAG